MLEPSDKRTAPLCPVARQCGGCQIQAMDYVCVDADVTMFMGSNQLNVKRIRKADEGEYIPSDYLPVSCLLYTSRCV